MSDAILIEAAQDRTGLSTGALAAAVGLESDGRLFRRVLAGDRDLPGSVRLMLQLITARPDLVPVLTSLRAGVPLEDPPAGRADLRDVLRSRIAALPTFNFRTTGASSRPADPADGVWLSRAAVLFTLGAADL